MIKDLEDLGNVGKNKEGVQRRSWRRKSFYGSKYRKKSSKQAKADGEAVAARRIIVHILVLVFLFLTKYEHYIK